MNINNKQVISFSLDRGQTFENAEVKSEPFVHFTDENGITYIKYLKPEDVHETKSI